MNPTPSAARLHAPDHGIANQLSWALAIWFVCGAANLASAQPGQEGQWSTAPSPSPIPGSLSSVHMALLPGGGNALHSRIVIWGGSHEAPTGAELGWSPGTAGCGAWPYPDFAQVPGSSWNPQADIFCAGHAQLATGPGLLTAGGDENSNSILWGIPDALVFTPGSDATPGTWSSRSDMQQSRFYPTVTALRDGRMAVTGGLRQEQEWYFGGRVNGSPPTGGAGDYLHRLGRGTKRIWDPPVTPVAAIPSDRPSPREGQTAVRFLYSAGDLRQSIFGGKDFNGITTDQNVYLLKREYGAALENDYAYHWLRLPVSGPFLPPARSDHVAIDLGGGSTSAMAMYGGLSQPSGGPAAVLNDFWKLAKVGPDWVWSTISASGIGPGPRHGHAAALSGSKMYLFGGSGASDNIPTDNRVYEFDFATGQWRILPVAAGPAPEPRRDHTMVLAGTSLVIYGGYTETAPSSSALWKLDLGAPTPAWSNVSTDGPSPGPRANHSAFYENSSTGPRLTFFGGDPPTTNDPAVDNRIYTIHPFPATGNATWMQGPPAPYRLSGHTVAHDPTGTLHAHLPEIYNPSGNAWTTQTSSGWFPSPDIFGDYPVQFLVPGTSIPGGGGRVLRVGPDPITRYLDIPATGIAGPWQTVPNGNNGSFRPLTGVQYEPGKILVIGTSPGGTGVPDDRARTLNALAIGTTTWEDRIGMQPRADPDILVLPNGKVLVVGDTNCPQIWSPGDGLWTSFSPLCGLAEDYGSRGYHATAMLLPDARVLTGSGNSNELLVYCPPYLFNADNSVATRPTINSAPTSLVFGEPFVIGKPTSDHIATACLIRPAAVTHSFDQNGRYVPLTFQTLPDGTGLQAWAPTSGSVAPPGDYLLFILNAQGVPAIAKWVHLGDCSQAPCDTDSPPPVTDMYPDIVGPNEVWMVWSAPGDDTAPLSGAYDLRMSTTGIASEQAYATATPVSGEPAVEPAGSPINFTVNSLSECTQYHLALKTRDGTGPSFKNWSLLSNTVTVTTTCGGGPGGGFSAVRVDGDREAGGVSATPVAPSEDAIAAGAGAGRSTNASSAGLAAASSLAAGAGVLEAETRRTRDGGWQVILRRLAAATGVEAADADAIVSQIRDKAGNWRTLGRNRPAPGNYPLGLCALRDQGRVVFPAGYGLDRVAPGLRSRGQECAMSRAEHSRSGAMGSQFLADGGGVEMAIGDVLTLTYDHAGTRPADEAGWYLLVGSTGLAAAPAAATGRRLGPRVPTNFALHQNQPNPFGRSTTIGFDLPVAGPVTLAVFDLLGRRVATLAQGDYPAGIHAVEWDLRGAGGVPVGAGVYVYRLESKEFRAQRKLSVVP